LKSLPEKFLLNAKNKNEAFGFGFFVLGIHSCEENV
jgi:hypothetical protein